MRCPIACNPSQRRRAGQPAKSQKSELAPPPPESPPPKSEVGTACLRASALSSAAMTSPNAADPAFIQCLSFPERRRAVKPWRIPPGPRASQRRMKSATPINNSAQKHRVPGMPLPAEIRLIGDESQDGDDRAHCDDEAVLLANAAREYDGRQAPDQHPRGPVERPWEFSGGPSAAPPLREQVQRRKLEVDGQVDAEPEERFDDRILVVEVRRSGGGSVPRPQLSARLHRTRRRSHAAPSETRSSSLAERGRRSSRREMHRRTRSGAISRAKRRRRRREPGTRLRPASANKRRR